MDYGEVIARLYDEVKSFRGQGKVADYIPALAEVDPGQYGIAVQTLTGKTFQVGDAETRFSIQSISKVFTLAMVTRHLGDELWKSVGSLRVIRSILLSNWSMNRVFRVILLSMRGHWW